MEKAGLKIGDEVYVIEKDDYVSVPCPVCHGAKKVKASTNGFTIIAECPICCSHGEIRDQRWRLVNNQPRKILGIMYENVNNKIVIKYKIPVFSGFAYDFYTEDCVFKSLSAAKKDLRQRNKSSDQAVLNTVKEKLSREIESFEKSNKVKL